MYLETIETVAHRKLEDHIEYKDGIKTVCVAACLSYLGIAKSNYKYTSVDGDDLIFEKTIKNYGYNLRRKTKSFNLKPNITTKTELKHSMKKSKFTEDDTFIVFCSHTNDHHLIILNGNGETVIDTAPGSRWKINYIKHVTKN